MASGVSLDPFQRIVNVGWAKNLFGVYVHVGTGNNVRDPDATVVINTPFGPRTLVDGFADAAGVNAPHLIVGADLVDFFAINRIFNGVGSGFNSAVQVLAVCAFGGLRSFDLEVDVTPNEGLTSVDFSVFTTKSNFLTSGRPPIDMPGNASGNPVPFVNQVSQFTATGTFNFHIDAATLDIS